MVEPDNHVNQLMEVTLQKTKIGKENCAKEKGGVIRDWSHEDLCLEGSSEADTLSMHVGQKPRGGEFKGQIVPSTFRMPEARFRSACIKSQRYRVVMETHT